MISAAGLILAGGQARRLGGGDKALRMVAGAPLLSHVAARLRPQVECLTLSANGPPERFAAWAVPVLADPLPGQPGPLAGILAGLTWAENQDLGWILSVAVDTPLLPLDLMTRLAAASGANGSPSLAASGGRVHPVCALWPVHLKQELALALSEGRRGVWAFAQAHAANLVTWPDQPLDPFVNVNTPDDLNKLENLLTPR